MKNVLVTGSGGSASLGFCRAMKKAPEEIFLVGVDCNPQSILLAETDKKYVIPRADNEDYVDVLNELIKKHSIDLLHPQPDPEVKAIAKNRDKINAHTFLPSMSAIEIAQDKFKTYSILKEQGVPVPKTILIKNKEDIEKAFSEIQGDSLWFRIMHGAGGKGSLLVKNSAIAEAWINHWDKWGKFTASKYLPGKNIGWDSIWKNGKLIASHTKERVAYALAGSSPSGISGTAGTMKSVKRPDVDEIGKKAILAIDPEPNGVFAVDLKEDDKGNAYLTEINAGRFLTSSLHFFAQSGYLLPYIYMKIALNEEYNFKLPDTTGKYLIRGLDLFPVLIDEETIKKMEQEAKTNKFFEVE